MYNLFWGSVANLITHTHQFLYNGLKYKINSVIAKGKIHLPKSANTEDAIEGFM